ncbi:MAG: nitronate monooxygenase [Candidatus Azambacteria bacterium]|nr:nitronate monooxygenase [Candidatus Azambacteria bacterium]
MPVVSIDGLNVIAVQGALGIGISRANLAKAVARRGWIGTVSSAALDYLHWKEGGIKVGVREATKREIAEAKSDNKFIAINCMVAILRSYKESIWGALDARVDAIVSGGGLPLALPKIVVEYEKEYGLEYQPALIPIVSSVRALELISKRWKRQPDGVILEGPMAGGHRGFSYKQLEERKAEGYKGQYELENLFPAVKKFSQANGDFPVIVAGGIFSHEDIVEWVKNRGADGVQLGSRFVVTHESRATKEFKEAIVNSKKGDVIISEKPGSPCGLPFGLLKFCPGLKQAREKTYQLRCTKGFVSRKDEQGNYTVCSAKDGYDTYCICNGLLAAIGMDSDGVNPFYTLGDRGPEITEIVSVDELIDELMGIK